VRHILNWGPEEKAPPKRGLKCTGITPLRGRRASAAGQFATRQLVPERKAPPDDGAKDSHAWGYTKGHSIQTPPVHIRGPTRPNWGWKLERVNMRALRWAPPGVGWSRHARAGLGIRCSSDANTECRALSSHEGRDSCARCPTHGEQIFASNAPGRAQFIRRGPAPKSRPPVRSPVGSWL